MENRKRLIGDIYPINLPQKYVQFISATVSQSHMGNKSISAQIRFLVEPGKNDWVDFSYNWEIEFRGEKYVHRTRQPQIAKGNTAVCRTADLQFEHWAIFELQRYFFVLFTEVESGVQVADRYIVPISLNIEDFCTALGKVLEHYWPNGEIAVQLNKGNTVPYSRENKLVEISYSSIWEVISKIYDIYGVSWAIEPQLYSDGTPNYDRYVIKIGYPAATIDHVFKYGYEGGLLTIERQVQDSNIRNILLGRGGSKNLPLKYFKGQQDDPRNPGYPLPDTNPTFAPDPDWIPELQNVSFLELRGATFRSYVQGWKAAHILDYERDYPKENGWFWEVTTPTADKAYAPWAWTRGYNDTKFNPVEFVADEYTIKKNGYEIKADSSIAINGELWGGLENNEDIYPSIQNVVNSNGVRIDTVVAVGEILDPNTPGYLDNTTSIVSAANFYPWADVIEPGETKTQTFIASSYITIPDDKSGTLIVGAFNIQEFVDVVASYKYEKYETAFGSTMYRSIPVYKQEEVKPPHWLVQQSPYEIHLEKQQPDGGWASVPQKDNGCLPAGTYKATVTVDFKNTSTQKVSAIIKLIDSQWVLKNVCGYTGHTFDVWIQDIWGVPRENGETDSAYTERVWTPILGDKEGQEAKIFFTSGQLSASQDYEFPIIAESYDTTQTLTIKNTGGTDTQIRSTWKLSLGYSEADLDSLGLLVPNEGAMCMAGDHFALIGIDMPHRYVVAAEKAVDDYKKTQLQETASIKPTWNITLDKVRLYTEETPGAALLADKLRVGASMQLQDPKLLPTAETFLLSEIAYEYTAESLLPDIQVTLSDRPLSQANPVSLIQSQIDNLNNSVATIITDTSSEQAITIARKAEKTANAASNTANSLNRQVVVAQSTANAAQADATAAKEDAKAAATKAADALNKAANAAQTATDAAGVAAEAIQKAGTAQETADGAKTTADQAARDITGLNTLVADNQKVAYAAQAAAANAQETADAAGTAAATAQTTADGAATAAAGAQTAANEAKETADAAQTDAATAKSDAVAAATKAASALSKAENAATDAADAEAAAGQAVSTANAAKEAADAAQRDVAGLNTLVADNQKVAYAAQADATKALGDAATAQKRADDAYDLATTAGTNAQSALNRLENVATTASDANAAALEAAQKATAAQGAAEKAQSDIDGYSTIIADNQKVAYAAQEAAGTAQETAESAQTDANTAKSNATAAKSTAEAAQSAANEALELARNAGGMPVTGFIPTSKNSTGYFTATVSLPGTEDRCAELSFTTSGDVTTNQYIFGDGTSLSKCISVRIAGGRLLVAGATLTSMQVWPNTQYHVVVMHSSGTVAVYINGSRMQTISATLTAISRITIGSFNTSTAVFKGTIHHVRIFNNFITPAQYELLWNNARPAQYSPYAPDFNGTLAFRFEPENISGTSWPNRGATTTSLTYTKVSGTVSTPTLDHSVTPDLTTMRMEQIVTTDISSTVAQIQTYYPRFFPERIFVQNLMSTEATGVALTYNVGTSIRATIGTLPAGYTAQSTPVVLYRDTDTMMKINAVATGVSSPGLRFIVYLKYMD